MASAARVVSPEESVVLISISSRKMSRASRWWAVCAVEGQHGQKRKEETHPVILAGLAAARVLQEIL